MMMKKGMKRLLISLVALLLIVGLSTDSLTASANAPYKTYTVDGYNMVTETQTAYLPYKTITKVGEEALSGPTDFTVTKDGYIYILDSGNKRVIVSTMEGDLVKIFGQDTLVNPKGIYVTEDHTTYVADSGAACITVFDENGKVIQSYGKPDHPLYGETQDFQPTKVVVNKSGTMYIVCESNTNGIVQVSPVDGGTFLGYFGTNATDSSLATIIWRSLLTKEQLARQQSNLPKTPKNLSIDEKGVIYTVTQGEEEDTLKRLNIAGVNMIDPDTYDDHPVAVTVGNHDNVFVASQNGYIYEYTNDGDLLFVFGGKDDGQQRIGLSSRLEAIQVDTEDRIYVLDSDKSQIQIYEPTEFTNYLHEALYLFSKGRYTQSKEPLSQVLQMNNLFDYANMAMGRALLQEENYEEAIKYAKLAKDYDGYSDAFWEIRNDWLKDNLVTAVVLIAIIWVAWKIVGFLDRRKGILARPRSVMKRFGELKLVQQLKFMFYFILHPIDGCYGIKREGKVSLLSTNILLALMMLFYVINKYFCGFLLKGVREGRFDIVSDIGMILIIVIFVVGCNYLMCTINDGEGKLKHIYSSFIYSFTPYLIITPIVFVLSHVVTYNEVFFVELASVIMVVWIAVLICVSIMEINNYSVKETAKIIALTVFTILIAALLVFIIYVLWSQVFDFIQAICGEVVYKIGS